MATIADKRSDEDLDKAMSIDDYIAEQFPDDSQVNKEGGKNQLRGYLKKTFGPNIKPSELRNALNNVSDRVKAFQVVTAFRALPVDDHAQLTKALNNQSDNIETTLTNFKSIATGSGPFAAWIHLEKEPKKEPYVFSSNTLAAAHKNIQQYVSRIRDGKAAPRQPWIGYRSRLRNHYGLRRRQDILEQGEIIPKENEVRTPPTDEEMVESAMFRIELFKDDKYLQFDTSSAPNVQAFNIASAALEANSAANANLIQVLDQFREVRKIPANVGEEKKAQEKMSEAKGTTITIPAEATLPTKVAEELQAKKAAAAAGVEEPGVAVVPKDMPAEGGDDVSAAAAAEEVQPPKLPAAVQAGIKAQPVLDRTFAEEETPAECVALRDAMAAFKEQQIDALTGKVNNYQVVSQNAQTLIATQQRLIAELQEKCKGAQGDLEKQLATLTAQLEECNTEKNQLDTTAAELRQQIAELEVQLTAVREELQYWRDVAADLEDEMIKTDGRLQTVLQLGEQAAEQLEVLQKLEPKTDNVKQNTEKMVTLKAQLEARRLALDAKLAKLTEQLREGGESLVQKQKEFDDLNIVLEKLRTDYGDIENQINALQLDKDKLNQQVQNCASALQVQKDKYKDFCQEQAGVLNSWIDAVNTLGTNLDDQIAQLTEAVRKGNEFVDNFESAKPAAASAEAQAAPVGAPAEQESPAATVKQESPAAAATEGAETPAAGTSAAAEGGATPAESTEAATEEATTA